MIYRTGSDTQQFIDNLTTIATVVKENKTLGETISGEIKLPKVQSLSPNFDIDIPANINLIGDCELESLLTLAATHRNTLGLALLIAPTDYTDKSFYYDDKYVSRSDCYYYTKTNYYLYNRLIIIHNLLAPHGIVNVLVTEPFLTLTRQLLDEIFGKNNAITTHIVIHNKSGSCKNGVLQQHQYVLVYAKDKQSALSQTAYKLQETTQFCIEKRGIFATSEGSCSEKTERKYEDQISTYDLVTNIRPQNRRENDNNYYPIYYIPGVFNSEGIDEQPRLFLEPTGHPEEAILLPKNEEGEDRIWNTIPATFMRNYKASSYCVRLINGKPKLYYKIRDNRSEDNMILEPVKTVLDENMSNMTTSSKIRKLMGTKEQYVGYNPNLAYYLISAYSKEGDKILSVGDRCLTVYVALLEYQLARTLITTVMPSLTDLDKYLKVFLSEYLHQHQFINFILDSVPDTTMLEFIEATKKKQEGLATLKYSGMALLVDNPSYKIYETRNFDVIVTMMMRYDLEVYLNLKDKLSRLDIQKYANTYIFFIDDSFYCQGQDILPNVYFINMLQDYKFIYNTLGNKLITKKVEQ